MANEPATANSAVSMNIFSCLRRFNIIAAILHAVSGAVMLWLSTDVAFPVTASFLQLDPLAQTLQPVRETLFEIQVGPLVAGFLFLSALAHASVSLIPSIYRWYVANLQRGINKARWVEYFFSSSLMIVAIAMLTGIYDIVALLTIFFLNGMMILFGWMMEQHNQTTARTDWTSFIFGCIAGAIPWVGVAIYLFGSGGEGGRAPTFVYWIFFSLFIFFNIFAVNMVLQYKKVGKWRDYLYGERAYIILSFVAKSLLAWQVFAGTLRP